jgi:hypothetical protein
MPGKPGKTLHFQKTLRCLISSGYGFPFRDAGKNDAKTNAQHKRKMRLHQIM